MSVKKVFEAAMLGKLPLKNRLIRSATWECLGEYDGTIPAELFEIYEELAAGGVGAIISGFTSVAGNDRYFDGMVRLCDDTLVPNHQKLTDIIHKYNCPVIVQLAMGEYNRDNGGRIYRNVAIDDMTIQDIEAVKRMFVEAALRAEKAGYDGVQIHSAHGFVLSRFISPFYNHRKDGYGGSPENRGRIIIEILNDIKAACPTLHVCMKINSSDFDDSGLTPEESLVICKMCANAGMDSIEVSGKGTSRQQIRPGINEAYFKDFAFALGKQIDIPIILVGGHRSLASMNQVLNEGNIEFLSLSRPLIREANLPLRWEKGDVAPAKCVSCNMCYQTPAHKCIFKLREGK